MCEAVIANIVEALIFSQKVLLLVIITIMQKSFEYP